MATIQPNPKQAYFNPTTGAPLIGGKLYTYSAGTNTPKNTYADSGNVTPNANPVILDARGEALIYWDGLYRIQLQDALGNVVYTVDNFGDPYAVEMGNLSSADLGKGADLIGFTNPSTSIATTVGDYLRALFASAGSALVGYINTATNAVARTVQDYLYDRVSVFDFMTSAQRADVRAGTLLVDVTTALQNAINYATGDGAVSAGKTLFLPAGNYKITAALSIPYSQGWKINGAGIGGTTITQATNNTPIFSFAKENTHSWEISDMFLTYASAQASANTAAVGIRFSADTAVGSGFYQWRVSRVNFDNGYQMFGFNQTSFRQNVFGCIIENCWCLNHVSGNFIDFVPSPAIGQPRINIRDCYVRADAMSLPYVTRITAADCLTMQCLEINNGTNIGILSLVGGTHANILSVKNEAGTYTAGGTGAAIFNFSDANVFLSDIHCDVGVLNVGAANTLYLFSNGGANGSINIDSLTPTVSTNTSGTIAIFSTSAANHQNRIGRIQGVTPPVPIYLNNTTSTAAADYSIVEEWQNGASSFNNGTTTPITLTAGSANKQYYNTALTADLTLNLPQDIVTTGGGNYNNLFGGITYRVTRGASATGAFNILVKNAAGTTIATLTTAGTFVEVTWVRTLGWIKTAGGTIP